MCALAFAAGGSQSAPRRRPVLGSVPRVLVSVLVVLVGACEGPVVSVRVALLAPMVSRAPVPPLPIRRALAIRGPRRTVQLWVSPGAPVLLHDGLRLPVRGDSTWQRRGRLTLVAGHPVAVDLRGLGTTAGRRELSRLPARVRSFALDVEQLGHLARPRRASSPDRDLVLWLQGAGLAARAAGLGSWRGQVCGVTLVSPQVRAADIVALAELGSVEWLHLDAETIDGTALARLSEVRGLSRLSMGGVDLSRVKAEQLPALPLLRTLSLPGAAIGPDSVRWLLGLRALEHLDLSYSTLASRDAARLSELPRLVELDLSGVPTLDATAQRTLAASGRLRGLYLDGERSAAAAVRYLRRTGPAPAPASASPAKVGKPGRAQQSR